MQQDPSPSHYFGFEKVNESTKSRRVREVFDKTSSHYDLMNHVMSLGLHIFWKKHIMTQVSLSPGSVVLDLACGSCDLSYYLLQKYPSTIEVVALDPCQKMLENGRNKLLDYGLWKPLSFCMGTAEALPFANESFDLVMIGFGYRNFTHQAHALNSIYRILKPGGSLKILEFSKPQTPLIAKVYDLYSQYVIPELGARIAGDRTSYQYLVDSIAMHPSAEALKETILAHAFTKVTVTPMTDGIVCLHEAWKGNAHE